MSAPFFCVCHVGVTRGPRRQYGCLFRNLIATSAEANESKAQAPMNTTLAALAAREDSIPSIE